MLIFKRHEHVLQKNTVLKERFPTNSFIVGNKKAKSLRELAARANPYNIKKNLLNQIDQGYKKVEVSVTLVIMLFLKKRCLYVLLQELNLTFPE